jgi:hypothetical protein
MNEEERNTILKQILWDYNIPFDNIDAVLKGKKEMAGHYTREMIFQKMIESFSWFTIIRFFTPNEIQQLLTNKVIQNLRAPSLRKNYEFVRKRLQEIMPIEQAKPNENPFAS